jgi:hypothetical protein
MKSNQRDNSSYGNLITEIGCLFLDKPYRKGTPGNQDREKLVFDLSSFDCVTLVETVLSLARCAASGKFSSKAFENHLKSIRYRGGRISGYSSRLHYFTDWLRDNVKKNILNDISAKLEATPRRKKINFMSTHPELYPALKNKTQLIKMTDIEKKLSRKSSSIIDKEKIGTQIKKIQSGDIIAFAASQAGLDVAHVGFAIRQGKSLRLLHASQKEGKVVIAKKTLVAYLKSNKQFTGIIVARVLEHC